MVRPFRHELERYGPATAAGETVYEHPFLWGSKRTGPDLQRVGGKYPHLWHVRHMENPRSTSPRSIMPPYPWMLERDAKLDNLPAKMRALSRAGVPYEESEIVRSVEHAYAQADEIAADIVAQGGPEGLERKEIVALIAFLQRLGVDGRQDLPSPALPNPVLEADSSAALAVR
jgi:cbb3-type cytochrome c oxidase subunit II